MLQAPCKVLSAIRLQWSETPAEGCCAETRRTHGEKGLNQTPRWRGLRLLARAARAYPRHIV